MSDSRSSCFHNHAIASLTSLAADAIENARFADASNIILQILLLDPENATAHEFQARIEALTKAAETKHARWFWG